MKSNKSCFHFWGVLSREANGKLQKLFSLLGVHCPGKQMESPKSCFPLRGILSREANGKPQKLLPFVLGV